MRFQAFAHRSVQGFPRLPLWLGALVALLLYALAVWHLAPLPRPEQEDVLRVRLPLLLQVFQAGGDRYLAADLNVIRSATVGGSVTDGETYRIQAAIQLDAARLNPRHEDNYYIAAAIVPWQGYVAEAQDILRLASDARPWDMMPPFFYAFNAAYFEHAYDEAGQWAEKAAQRVGEPNATALRTMAAKWYERGDDPDQAIEMIERIKQLNLDAKVLPLLDARIQRLQGLKVLREAAARFQARYGHSPTRLQDLLDAGLLPALPPDPLRIGYVLDAQGVPQLALSRNGQ
ncbi:hypothetical protein [Corticibacter populi]|uniref:hypothetical protein n=1 Tax=Corticibacter populi TaxID=1550736 RepID=UPI0013C3606C|nr:hypothetical protein [Corticibacter populi]